MKPDYAGSNTGDHNKQRRYSLPMHEYMRNIRLAIARGYTRLTGHSELNPADNGYVATGSQIDFLPGQADALATPSDLDYRPAEPRVRRVVDFYRLGGFSPNRKMTLAHIMRTLGYSESQAREFCALHIKTLEMYGVDRDSVDFA